MWASRERGKMEGKIWGAWTRSKRTRTGGHQSPSHPANHGIRRTIRYTEVRKVKAQREKVDGIT